MPTADRAPVVSVVPPSDDALAPTLQDALQQEFPALDASVIAALLHDHDVTSNDSPNLLLVRQDLMLLSELAEEHQSSEQSLPPQSLTSVSTTSTSLDSIPSSMPSSSFQQALNFLTTMFPDMQLSEISRIVSDLLVESSDASGDELDMERAVHLLMAQEQTRDLEERDLNDLPGNLALAAPGDLQARAKRHKGRRVKGPAIHVNDVRQSGRIQPSFKSSISPPRPSIKSSPLDPWTEMTSLNDFFVSLVPRCGSQYFLSYLHNPTHESTATAIRRALANLPRMSELNFDKEAALSNMIQVIYTSIPPDNESRTIDYDTLVADAKLALEVCALPDDALQIILRLQELDEDPISLLSNHVSFIGINDHLSGGILGNALSSPASHSDHAGDALDLSPVAGPSEDRENSWTTIPARRVKSPHPLAASIPAYARASSFRGEDEKHLAELQIRAQTNRRNALMQASSLWHRAGKSSHSAAASLYYAERARSYAKENQKWGMRKALVVVEKTRRINSGGNTGSSIDLHGLNIAEAKFVVQGILDQGGDGCSKDRPLDIITGIGKHSRDGIGVLAPAVFGMLTEQGWEASSYAGGVIVRGRRSNG